jgi:hypothetical protein
VLRVAVPEDNVPVPIDVPLSLNVTDPVGVPLVLDDTPAVKVTLVPAVMLVEDVCSVVTEAAVPPVITSESGAETDPP